MPRLQHAQRRAHQLIGVFKAAQAPQLIGDDALLQPQLQGIVGVLPAAATAAFAVVLAGRLDTTWRSALNADKRRSREVAPLLLDSHQRAFIRQPARNEDNAPIREVAQGVAAERGIRELDGDGRKAQLALRSARLATSSATS